MTSPLKTLIDELTIPHDREHEGAVGTEDPLLVLLATAVGSDIGAHGGGGTNAPGGVIDAHALDILSEIRADVRRESPVTLPGDTLPGTVRRWYNEVSRWDATEHATLRLYELALGWRSEIRHILEPVKRTPMRGQVCPGCHLVEHRNPETGVRSPAITLNHLTTPIAVCANCGESWEGGELLDLRAGRVA